MLFIFSRYNSRPQNYTTESGINMSTTKMTASERRATLSLSIIMGLRMIAYLWCCLFFSLYARDLAGATPLLIGTAMGVYGLFQAIFQISFARYLIAWAASLPFCGTGHFCYRQLYFRRCFLY